MKKKAKVITIVIAATTAFIVSCVIARNKGFGDGLRICDETNNFYEKEKKNEHFSGM